MDIRPFATDNHIAAHQHLLFSQSLAKTAAVIRGEGIKDALPALVAIRLVVVLAAIAQ
jgi:hypothetical protein